MISDFGLRIAERGRGISDLGLRIAERSQRTRAWAFRAFGAFRRGTGLRIKADSLSPKSGFRNPKSLESLRVTVRFRDTASGLVVDALVQRRQLCRCIIRCDHHIS